MDLMAVATAWQMLEGCVEEILVVSPRRSRWRSLRWVRDDMRAFSGGDRIDMDCAWLPSVVFEVRSGDAWPERERRISWSMLTFDS